MKIRLTVFIFIYSTIITLVSKDLGLIYVEVVDPAVESKELGNVLEALFYAVNTAMDNFNVFLQFMTLQTDMPVILNTLLVSPIYVTIVMLFVLIVRGTN